MTVRRIQLKPRQPGRWAERLAIFGVALSVLGLSVVSFVNAHALQSSLPVTPAVRQSIVDQDAACNDRLNTGPHSTTTIGQRDNVNNSQPYGTAAWVSPLNKPTQDTVVIPYPYTSTTLSMQYNEMNFLCDILVSPLANNDRNYPGDPALITQGNFPNDHLPNAFDSIPDGYSVNTEHIMIKSVNVVGGGSVSGAVPYRVLTNTRDPSTRFWFLDSSYAFSYRTPATIPPGGLDVTFVVTFEQYHDYHADKDSPTCEYGGGTPVVSARSFGCRTVTALLGFHVRVGAAPPPPGFTNTPYNSATPSTVMAGTTTRVTYTAGVTTVTTRPSVTYALAVTPPTFGTPVGAIPGGSKTVGPGTATYNYQYDLNVPAATPNGTSICSSLGVTPHSDTDAPQITAPACVTVINPKLPLVNVAAGDTHAGCGTPTVGMPGTITTNTGASDVEMVGASGTITGLYSAVNTNNASLDGYVPSTTYPLCLPNLLTVAQNYSGALTAVLPGGSYDVGSAPFASGGVVKIAGNATLTGTVKSRVTVWVIGTLTVRSVRIDPAAVYQRSTLPGLGVIAGGDINLVSTGAAVDEADGYYWSSGTINTCSAGNCNNVLQVNGFLLGHQVKLQRWGAAGASRGTVAENVALTGQLYLNPPLLFDVGSSAFTTIDGRGEQSPRY